jgi:hypothetical protein
MNKINEVLLVSEKRKKFLIKTLFTHSLYATTLLKSSLKNEI